MTKQKYIIPRTTYLDEKLEQKLVRHCERSDIKAAAFIRAAIREKLN